MSTHFSPSFLFPGSVYQANESKTRFDAKHFPFNENIEYDFHERTMAQSDQYQEITTKMHANTHTQINKRRNKCMEIALAQTQLKSDTQIKESLFCSDFSTQVPKKQR